MNYVLFHKSCIDGFVSAWVCWKRYGDTYKYIPVTYNEAPPVLEDIGNVVIVDFSYNRSVLQLLKNRLAVHGKELVVIDHHATAEKDLKDLDYCVFDNNHSGAVLTWMTLFPDKPVPQLLLYVEDRDLWAWKLSDSKEVNEGIGMLDKSGDLLNQEMLLNNFKNFDIMVDHGRTELKNQGVAILGYKDKLISETIKYVEIKKFGGYNAGFINLGVGSLISDIGNECLKSNDSLDIVCLYAINLKENIVNCSLRGHDKEGVDCGIIAKQWNGGGHRNAAGFKISIKEFFELFKNE